jgi:hypothetical protein
MLPLVPPVPSSGEGLSPGEVPPPGCCPSWQAPRSAEDSTSAAGKATNLFSFISFLLQNFSNSPR